MPGTEYTAATGQTLSDFMGEHPNVAQWSGYGDAVELTGGSMTSGDNVFYDPSASFNANDVGKLILVKGAGAPNDDIWINGWLVTTIDSITDGNHVVVHDNAGSDVSSAYAIYGTDNYPIIQSAINAVKTPKGYLTITAGGGGSGIYLLSSGVTIDHSMTINIERVSLIGHVDYIFNINSDGVTIDGYDRSTSHLKTVKGTANCIICQPQKSHIIIRNLKAEGPPRWYDEANLNYGNAIYCGANAEAGNGSFGDPHAVGIVIERCYIVTGQNGVCLGQVTDSNISRCYFETGDRTGTQAVDVGTFGSTEGLSHVTTIGCIGISVSDCKFTAATAIANAIYFRPDYHPGSPFTSDAFIPYFNCSAENNRITGLYKTEAINTFNAGTIIRGNAIYIETPYVLTSGIACQGNSDNCVVSGNSIYITDGASHYGVGIILYGLSSTITTNNISVSGNTVTCPGRAIYCADYIYGTNISSNTVTINSSGGEGDGIRIASNALGRSNNHIVNGNTVKGAVNGIRCQGASTEVAIMGNIIISPSGNGIEVLDGAGANFLIKGNRVSSPAYYGVNIVNSATGPITLGHNEIYNAGTAEYARGISSISPERHQDANIRKIGINQDPSTLIDVRDDVGGSKSIRLRGNSFREIAMEAADPSNGSNTSCVLSGTAHTGTIDSPSDTGAFQECVRLVARVLRSTIKEVAFVSTWGGVTGAAEEGWVDIWTKSLGGSLRRVARFIQDGSFTIQNTSDTAIAKIDSTGAMFPQSGGSGPGIYSGTGAPSSSPASGSIYLQSSAGTGIRGVWEYVDGSGWSLIAGGDLKGKNLTLSDTHPFFKLIKSAVEKFVIDEDGNVTKSSSIIIDSSTPAITMKNSGTTKFSVDSDGNITGGKVVFDGPSGSNPLDVRIATTPVLTVSPLGVTQVLDFVISSGGQCLVNGAIILNDGVATGGKLIRTNSSTLALEEVAGVSSSQAFVQSVSHTLSDPIPNVIDTTGMTGDSLTIATAVNAFINALGAGGTVVKSASSVDKTATLEGGAITAIA